MAYEEPMFSFSNFRTMIKGPNNARREAFAKALMSGAALAFITAAFSAYIPTIPEEVSTICGGAVGFIIGCVKVS